MWTHNKSSLGIFWRNMLPLENGGNIKIKCLAGLRTMATPSPEIRQERAICPVLGTLPKRSCWIPYPALPRTELSLCPAHFSLSIEGIEQISILHASIHNYPCPPFQATAKKISDVFTALWQDSSPCLHITTAFQCIEWASAV